MVHFTPICLTLRKVTLLALDGKESYVTCYLDTHSDPPAYSGTEVIKNFMVISAEHKIFLLINIKKCQQLLAF